jgi:hypothetical protein
MLLQSLQARKIQEQSTLHKKKISEAMDKTFPICNTLPQTFLM